MTSLHIKIKALKDLKHFKQGDTLHLSKTIFNKTHPIPLKTDQWEILSIEKHHLNNPEPLDILRYNMGLEPYWKLENISRGN